MKTRELLEKHPNATEIIVDYYNTLITSTIKDEMPENFKEFLKANGFNIDNLETVINANPRSLLDVFDKHEIYASLDMHFVEGKPIFGVNINGAVSEIKFAERRGAEEYLVMSCIKFLDDKVNENS